MDKSDFVELQSKTINFLRFPMAIAVVFIHTHADVGNLVDADFKFFSWQGIYNVVGVLFSHVLSHIAVPLFFFISGLLFFINFREWSWLRYRKKIKSRIYTLIIPYILWNLIPFLLFLLGYMVIGVKNHSLEEIKNFLYSTNINLFYDYHSWETVTNWFGKKVVMSGPFNFPLWFLRDLIFVSVLTPLIYYLINKLKVIFIILLLFAYLSNVWISIPGLSVLACFFYSLGAYISINLINVFAILKKYRKIVLTTSLILLFESVVYYGMNTIIGSFFYPFFIIFMSSCVFYFAFLFVDKSHLMVGNTLISSCFFIYVFHCMPLPLFGNLNHLIRVFLLKIMPGQSPVDMVIVYFANPFFTVAICVFLFRILTMFLPRVSGVFMGNR